MRSSASPIWKPSRIALAPARVIEIAELREPPPQTAEPLRHTDAPPENVGGDPSQETSVFTNQLLAARRYANDMLQQAQATADSMVAEARQEAQALLADAQAKREEAQVILQRAHEQAEALHAQFQQEGREAGMAAVRQEVEAEIDRLSALTEAAVEARAELLAATEPEIVALALAIARKVVARELQLDREAVVDIVGHALSLAATTETRRVYLHPDDAELVRTLGHQRLAEQDWEIVPDEDLQPGDCIVRTSHGCVDTRLETQFARLEEALLGRENDG